MAQIFATEPDICAILIPEAAAAALPRTGHLPLDETLTEIGIHQPALGTANRL